MSGDCVSVDLTNMSITINGESRSHPPKMLHDSGPMKSVYGSGKITIETSDFHTAMGRKRHEDKTP